MGSLSNCWHPESGRGLPQSKTFGGSFDAVVAKRLGVRQSSAAFEHATQSFLCVAVWQFGLDALLRASQPFRLSRAGQASPASAARAGCGLPRFSVLGPVGLSPSRPGLPLYSGSGVMGLGVVLST